MWLNAVQTPWVSYPEVKVQVRDLGRVVGIVAPFAPQLQETCAGCQQQRYTTGEPGKVQGRDLVGIVEWSLTYRARGVSIREKSFYRETRGTRRGGRHVAKRSSDPRVAYPEVKVQVRDPSASCGYCCSLCPAGVSIFGEKSFYLAPGCKGDLYRVPQAAVHHGRARQSSGTGPCGYCRRVLWVPDPRGQYSGKIHSIEKPGVQDKGVVMWLTVVLTPGEPTPKSNFRYGT